MQNFNSNQNILQMAEKQCAGYCQAFGNPPKQAQHLIAFASLRGVTINWEDANRVLESSQGKGTKMEKKRAETYTHVIGDKIVAKNDKHSLSVAVESDIDFEFWDSTESDDDTIEEAARSTTPPRRAEVYVLQSIDNIAAELMAHITSSTINDKSIDTTHQINMLTKELITAPSAPRSHSKHQTSSASNKKGSHSSKRPSVVSSRYQHLIHKLTSMGWDEEQSLKAITASHGNLPLAIESLMSGDLEMHSKLMANPQTETSNRRMKAPLRDTQTLLQALNQLASGHASIKQRLNAMDALYHNLNALNITCDNGRTLLSVFAQQLLHQDYIYREYAVRIKALTQISDVFRFCLHAVNDNQSVQVLNITESLTNIVNCLFLLLDDNKAMKFHAMVRQSVDHLVHAVIEQKHKTMIIDLCGTLNEKGHCENITQAHARFFAAKQIFQKILFGLDVCVHAQWVTRMFNINIGNGNHKLVKYTNGIPQDEYQNSTWLQLVIANTWEHDEEETFKDIIADSVSVMMMDPNSDIAIIGFNLAVYLYGYNPHFVQHLDPEAKYRFEKNYGPPPQQAKETLQPIKSTKQQIHFPMDSGSPMPVRSYRIKQETPLSVASPTLLPDL